MRLIGLAVVLAVGLVLAPRAAEAQQTGKVYRIGYVGNSSPSLEPKLLSAFRDGLRDLGYVEGQNIRIEYRWAEGRYERFPDFMAELIRLKVDLIVVAGTPATLAAKRATNAIPIVMAVIGDALEAGVVPSLARPGGNITACPPSCLSWKASGWNSSSKRCRSSRASRSSRIRRIRSSPWPGGRLSEPPKRCTSSCNG